MAAPDAAALVEKLEAAWRRSDALFALLAPDAFHAQPIALRQPFVFYVGHLPAFAWNQIGAGLLGRGAFDVPLDTLFARGIDPVGVDAYVPAARWPALDAVDAYREAVRAGLRALRGEPRLDEPGGRTVLHTVLEHELMHQETLLYMAQELPLDRKRRPQGLAYRFASGGRTGTGRARIAAGWAALGARPEDTAFGWDNEFPEHRVHVDGFGIDVFPTRIGQFLEFVNAGGYDDRRHWNDDDWAWRARTGVRHPRAWRAHAGGWRLLTLFDELSLDDASEWPASVSLAEARAYARFRGARLPTESELQRAAYATPDGGLRRFPWGDEPDPDAVRGNFGFRSWAPEPVGARPAGVSAWGVHELVGNGWEWTETVFAPFPGFQAMRHYPGYSADFFDGRHFVLKGASWATDTTLVRPSLRNWFQPHYPYVFSKFRLAYA